MSYTIAALYKFHSIADTADLQQNLKPQLAEWGICGSLLIAPEGINGTLAGCTEAIERMLQLLHEHVGLSRDDVKFSYHEEKPFQRLKVRLKKEIITMRQPDADPNIQVGQYVEPEDWNKLIEKDDVVLLDTRNDYETEIGLFNRAIDPKIRTFTEFVTYVDENLDPQKHKKIAMYCTGGIRCEKASAFMLARGFEEVFHLKGGILKYLEAIPQEQSLWQGDCFVFDRRTAVGHGLKPGAYSSCHCCGNAVSPQDKEHPLFEEGVSCPKCHEHTSQDDKARYRMRQQQVEQTEHRA